MKKILEHRLATALRDAGFEVVERRALETFAASMESYMDAHLRAVASVSRHALKSHATLLDMLAIVDRRLSVPVSRSVDYVQEMPRKEPRFESPLASSIEKYIHIYEFMPGFPPTHAFRQTIAKPNSRSSRSLNVKHRLEQSLRSEGNLLQLIRASGSLPPFINFLYR